MKMKTFQEYLNAINKAIASIPYPEVPRQLYEPIAYHMVLGGKRVRPEKGPFCSGGTVLEPRCRSQDGGGVRGRPRLPGGADGGVARGAVVDANISLRNRLCRLLHGFALF